MSIVLESVVEATEGVQEPTEPVESVAPEPAEVAAEPAAPMPAPAEQAAPVTPVPKKRGRPRKDAAAHATTPATAPATTPAKVPRARPKRAATAPVAEVAVTPPSEEDEPMSQQDLETEILHFLVQRRSQQQDRRRQLWSQLAGLG